MKAICNPFYHKSELLNPENYNRCILNKKTINLRQVVNNKKYSRLSLHDLFFKFCFHFRLSSYNQLFKLHLHAIIHTPLIHIAKMNFSRFSNPSGFCSSLITCITAIPHLLHLPLPHRNSASSPLVL